MFNFEFPATQCNGLRMRKSRQILEQEAHASSCRSLRHNASGLKSDSKSADRKVVGVRPPSRHHLKYQYPLLIHRLAALVDALCFACARVGPTLRYKFRYSADPLSFNILAPLAADLISADYPKLRQITECAADLMIDSRERRFLRR